MTTQVTIGMILFPGLTHLDLTGPFEVFGRIPDARVLALGATMDPVRSDTGLSILPDLTFGQAPPLDVVCVPGGPGVNQLLEDEAFLEALGQWGRSARYVTSVCSGALLLGAAGLLDGYRATTHWLSMEFLPVFGAIPVAERVVIDRNRITGGGVTAGIDFGLVLAARLAGEEVAKRIQLMLEYNPAPPFAAGHPSVAEPDVVQAVRDQGAAYVDARWALTRRAAEAMRRRLAGAA